MGSSLNGDGCIGTAGELSFCIGISRISEAGVVSGLVGIVGVLTLLTAFTDVFSEYDIVGVPDTILGVDNLSAEVCNGEASNGGTFATGFCIFVAAGGVRVVGLDGSSIGTMGEVADKLLGLLEKRLAHDFPGAGCG